MAENVDDDTMKMPDTSLWHENHGNLLLGVIVGILVVGVIALFISQNRLRKPRFPDARAIQQVNDSAETQPVWVEDADAELTVVVIGAVNEIGSIKAAIYDSIEKFNVPENAFRKETLEIVDGEATLRIAVKDLPPRFAIATFHDENDDGQLNRNRIGIPTERYGFSRNARGLTGPPAFEDAFVDRAAIPKVLEISIR